MKPATTRHYFTPQSTQPEKCRFCAYPPENHPTPADRPSISARAAWIAGYEQCLMDIQGTSWDEGEIRRIAEQKYNELHT